MKYLPALDGLRGLAVLLVMVFHAGAPFLRGGFIGVDVFFVLSGFLITAILIAEYDKEGTIGLKNFYVRRFLRLIPALWIVVIALLAFGLLLLNEELKQILIGESLVSILYISNWAYAFKWVESFYLAHTWSLAIEEQFYLLWPLLFLFVLNRSHNKKQLLLAVCLALIAVINLWRVYLLQDPENVKRVYYAFDTRADSILAGCALALFMVLPAFEQLKAKLNKLPVNMNLLVGLLLLIIGICALVLNIDAPSTFIFALPLVSLCSVLITLLLMLDKSQAIQRIFEWQGLVYIGKISYGLYLWHVPLYVIIRSRVSTDWLITLAIGFSISLIVCTLQYYAVERPFLRLKAKFR